MMALKLIEESIAELESTKGSIATGVNKLLRASKIIGESKVTLWSEIVEGYKWAEELKRLFDSKEKGSDGALSLRISKDKNFLSNLSTDDEFLQVISSLFVYMLEESFGGLNGIRFIEDKYLGFIKNKRGNDGTYYLNNLKRHLEIIRSQGLQLAHPLYEKLKFSGATQGSFEILKTLIDDKILDLEPELAEQLMLAFKSVSSDNKEEWSQALTTCRRLLEGLADRLFPATSEPVNGRVLKQNQYVNRLWAFMDKAIESESNKELAKAHVDLIGAWIQRINNLANKGVHAEVTQVEAVKMVFHTYLMLADILEYLDASELTKQSKIKLKLSVASLDEFEACLNVSRAVAKEIIKIRVQNGGSLSFEQLAKVKGIGAKTLQMANESFNE